MIIAVFTLIAASHRRPSPVIGYLIAAESACVAPLERCAEWLAHENAVVVAVLLLVIGVVLIGKGIASF